MAEGQKSDSQKGRGLGLKPSLSPLLLADTLGATLPDVALELEVRPQTATGLVFHLGQGQTPPYLELQVLGKQVRQV